MRIKFLATVVYEALQPVTHEAGAVLECKDDYGQRWIRRGKAEEITVEEFRAAKAAPKPKGKK